MESMKESILSEHKLEDLETVKEVDYLKKNKNQYKKEDLVWDWRSNPSAYNFSIRQGIGIWIAI